MTYNGDFWQDLLRLIPFGKPQITPEDTYKTFRQGKPPFCSRCNDNGCPACDGTKGDKHNPEPY